MHSVGEAMSIGRTFKASLQKALRSLERSHFDLGGNGSLQEWIEDYKAHKKNKNTYYQNLSKKLERPHPQRIFSIQKALYWAMNDPESNFSLEKIANISGLDPWFLYQMQDLLQKEKELASWPKGKESLRELKELGYSDQQLAYLKIKEKIQNVLDQIHDQSEYEVLHKIRTLLQEEEDNISQQRKGWGIIPVYKRVDTCAGEFFSHTPYLYSSYEEEDESSSQKKYKKKVLIIGAGPNRIGQGIEFDYCCCHASFTLQEMGIESIMVNSNPETVSTDYDISDKLYFEPLTLEDILHICEREKPDGLIVSFGGQTPLVLSHGLDKAGWKILGTQVDAIDRAEDRNRFSKLLKKLGLQHPPFGLAYTIAQAKEIVKQISYPLLVRPSYVLGGRAMQIIYEEESLKKIVEQAIQVSPEHPIYIDQFLADAIEIDVDALSDGEEVFVGGIMQHIEEAGVHSGDSACILPPSSLSETQIQEIEEATRKIALELKVVGLLNIQFAIYQSQLYVIEVNPRASRTIPFVSKSIGIPLAKLATKVMWGSKIKDLEISQKQKKTVSVKEAVLPFSRFPGSDIILGPEMKSTGEVMGLANTLGQAYIKALLSTGEKVPKSGGIFFSISATAKDQLLEEAKILANLGFQFYSTKGTAEFLKKHNISVQTLYKMRDKKNPNPLELLQKNKIQLIVNIPHSNKTRDDAMTIRQEAVKHKILCVTTTAGTKALARGLEEMKSKTIDILSLQELHHS